MENVELRFKSDNPNFCLNYLHCFANRENSITISILNEENRMICESVYLNKHTAIRLVKELKKQINFME